MTVQKQKKISEDNIHRQLRSSFFGSVAKVASPAQKQTERCHPEDTRPLTIREYARIQTFPDNWQFCGSLTSQYKQIGNAVPVNLAYAIGRSLIRLMNDIGLDSF